MRACVPHFLIVILQLFISYLEIDEIVAFKKEVSRNFAAHVLSEKLRFWTKIRDFAAHFLSEKRRFWTKIRDFAARFFFEKRRFWTKIRQFGAHFFFEK